MADRPSGGPVDDDVVGWLLDADPALRWQVERDVVHAPPSVWRATRARVATPFIASSSESSPGRGSRLGGIVT